MLDVQIKARELRAADVQQAQVITGLEIDVGLNGKGVVDHDRQPVGIANRRHGAELAVREHPADLVLVGQGERPATQTLDPFFFKRGGGPVLDIGSYPITQLINCLGPVASVTAHASRAQDSRTVTSELRRGEVIAVEVPTMVNGVLAFANGANVAVTLSWDIWKHTRLPIELYRTEGSLLNPDPNFFGGSVRVSKRNGDWQELPIEAHPFGRPTRKTNAGLDVADYRMVGVLDMACAAAEGRPHGASGELARHVLEVMGALERPSAEGRQISIETSCERPDPIPLGIGEEVFVEMGRA